MKDIGRTRDAADWQKWPDAKARSRVSFTRGFSRRHCTRHLDSIAPSLGADGMEAIGAISDGRCREKVARWDGQQPLGQLVCVGVTAESGGDGGGEGKGEVPQPWHDALLKIGKCIDHDVLWGIRARQFDFSPPLPGVWGLGSWASMAQFPLGIAANRGNAPNKQPLMDRTWRLGQK